MTVVNHGLIWFGAAISIAEILTGAMLAPLGFGRALAAIALGHAVGGVFMYLAGMIGARTGLSAMETVKGAFGTRGGLLFAALNVTQLVGWTAVMIHAGAGAAVSLLPAPFWIWCAAIAALVALWVALGIGGAFRLNLVTMIALFALSALLSRVVFAGGGVGSPSTGAMTFGGAVELSAAMPLSWLPLIADYTRHASRRPRAVTFAGAAVYGLASCWMYVIGLGAAILTGESDVARILAAAGFGGAALAIVLGSTVTTTFLDVHSAGVASVSIASRLDERKVAGLVCLAGAVLAAFTPITRYEAFLYFISSVFAPMAAVLVVDYYGFRSPGAGRRFNSANLGVWTAGFVLYRVLLACGVETAVGLTVPVMAATGALAWVAQRARVAFASSKRDRESGFRG